MKRLALFMDGTWNAPDSKTNVYKLYCRTASHGNEGTLQLKHYVTGVGTSWHEKIRGGAFGLGLSRNVQEGYKWLVENYEENDEIYIFGFSRGAYTARSVVGFMSRCGLLRTVSGPISVERLFERYKAGKRNPKILGLRALQSLDAEGASGKLSPEDRSLLNEARRVPIQYIGVWDTVGALGIPSGKVWLPWNRTKYYFHDLDLSSLVRNAAHALAIDEHRKAYSPSLWTQFTPDGASPRVRPGVEQRWFVGAHSNVGGGYANNHLDSLPRSWIESKAVAQGLAFTGSEPSVRDAHLEPIVDSFEDFLLGLYSKVKERHFRVIGWPRTPVSKGTSQTINETIDGSVFMRWNTAQNEGNQSLYRPKNIQQWAEKAGVNPALLERSVSAFNPSATAL